MVKRYTVYTEVSAVTTEVVVLVVLGEEGLSRQLEERAAAARASVVARGKRDKHGKIKLYEMGVGWDLPTASSASDGA